MVAWIYPLGGPFFLACGSDRARSPPDSRIPLEASPVMSWSIAVTQNTPTLIRIYEVSRGNVIFTTLLFYIEKCNGYRFLSPYKLYNINVYCYIYEYHKLLNERHKYVAKYSKCHGTNDHQPFFFYLLRKIDRQYD